MTAFDVLECTLMGLIVYQKVFFQFRMFYFVFQNKGKAFIIKKGKKKMNKRKRKTYLNPLKNFSN